MDRMGPARALSHGERRRLAAALRSDTDIDRLLGALLDAYGHAVNDFVLLMLGPDEIADRVTADTMVAAIGLAGRLRDDDLLSAWIFALARHLCHQHPPVVWREREWRGLRDLARARGHAEDMVPPRIVRMALLGISPRHREVLILSSTYCKLLSSDLAAIYGVSGEEAAAMVASAHQWFEKALAMSAKEARYKRDPRSRAPEIGELIGAALNGVQPGVPEDWAYYTALAPEMAAHRQEVCRGIELARADGFPVRGPRRQAADRARMSARHGQYGQYGQHGQHGQYRQLTQGVAPLRSAHQLMSAG